MLTTLRYFLCYLVIIFALILTLVRGFLWNIEAYKSELERKIYQLTSIPIKIGGLRGSIRGFNPEIILHNIQLLNAIENDQSAIKLKQMRLNINLWQLLTTRELLPASDLTFIGVNLSILRDKTGKFSIVGLNPKNAEPPLWLLTGQQYTLLDSDFIWHDQLNNTPPMTFNHVNGIIKNQPITQTHELHLMAQLPEQLGNKLRVSLIVNGNIFEKETLSGQGYIEGNHLQLSKLWPTFLVKEINVSQGSVDIKLWGQKQKFKHLELSGYLQLKKGVFDYKKQHASFQINSLKAVIKGNNKQGNINLHVDNARFFFPELFRQPLSIDTASSLINWQQLNNQWQFSSDKIILTNPDGYTETTLSLTLPKKDEAVFIDLHSAFTVSDVSQIPNYYPVGIMDKELLDWLDKSFVSGKIKHGRALIYGELNQFPFTENQGTFEALLHAEEVELQYHPEWPNLTQGIADIEFLNNGLTVKLAHATVDNMVVNQALVKIPSFSNSDHLLIQGQVEGETIAGLHFLQQTPLDLPIESLLNFLTPSGLTQVDLDLKIPLVNEALVRVDGMAYFNQAAVKIKPIDLDITQLSGELKFSEQTFSSNKINAYALGYPIHLKVKDEMSNIAINIKGKTDFLQLKQKFKIFDHQLINAHRMTGATAYEVKLVLPKLDKNLAMQLEINSHLAGLAMDLPDLLKKTAEQEKLLTLNLAFNEEDILLPLRLNYNDDLKIAININKQQNKIHSVALVYGQGQAIAPLKKEINITLNHDFFNLSEWSGLVLPEHQYTELEFNHINININNLLWNEQNYGTFQIAIQRLDQQWQGNIACALAKGQFIIPFTKNQSDKINLEMDFLDLSGLLQIEFPADQLILNINDEPLIQLSSNQLLWQGRNLGRLEIDTERRINGIRFKRIAVNADAHKIELQADWFNTNGKSMTQISGNLQADNFGNFLSQFEITNDLKESSANIDYFGHWLGSPYQFSLATIEAKSHIILNEGRISSIEPGIGRVLGLIAIEQWIKRLTLDFGDVYKEGLSFNNITGNFTLKEGTISTNDLLIDAVPARITMKGEVDLLAQKLAYEAEVVPKSSDALPIAGTIVGGIVGMITQAFAPDYKEGYFFASKYKITGQWDDIKVIPLHDQDGILTKTWTGLTDFSWMKTIIEE